VNAGFVLDRVAEVSDAGKEGASASEDGEGEFGYGVDMMIYCERFFMEGRASHYQPCAQTTFDDALTARRPVRALIVRARPGARIKTLRTTEASLSQAFFISVLIPYQSFMLENMNDKSYHPFFSTNR
jgi:hypothetical protein